MITKFLEYLGLRPKKPLTKQSELVEFIHRNASFVSQVTLLTYIKARAGTQYPKLFENPEYLKSIEIARSHLYASCVADLAFCSWMVLKFEVPGHHMHEMQTQMLQCSLCFALLLPRRALSCHLASAVLSEHLSAWRCVPWLLPRLFCAGAVSASGSDAAFELHVVPPSQSSAELSHIVDTFAAATDADLATGQQALQSQLREVLASTAKSIQLVVGGAARVRA